MCESPHVCTLYCYNVKLNEFKLRKNGNTVEPLNKGHNRNNLSIKDTS